MATKKTQKVPKTNSPLPSGLSAPTPVTVFGALSGERVNLHLMAEGREGVLHELVALIVPAHEAKWRETLFEALKAREDLCPTCVSEGIAIPHSRNALVGLVDHAVLAYGRHPVGMDYGALDRKPVHHFFLLCAPNVREHLQLLSRLARLLNQPGFRQGLEQATDATAVLALVQQHETV
jgi:mannitol/fructose-specific phosphotransferase system IIA component (Ntr-type)